MRNSPRTQAIAMCRTLKRSDEWAKSIDQVETATSGAVFVVIRTSAGNWACSLPGRACPECEGYGRCALAKTELRVELATSDIRPGHRSRALASVPRFGHRHAKANGGGSTYLHGRSNQESIRGAKRTGWATSPRRSSMASRSDERKGGN